MNEVKKGVKRTNVGQEKETDLQHFREHEAQDEIRNREETTMADTEKQVQVPSKRSKINVEASSKISTEMEYRSTKKFVKTEPGQQILEEPANSVDNSFYEVLTVNEYVDLDKEGLKSTVKFWCKCPMPPKGQSGCTIVTCENRAKKVECDLPLCKAGDQCSNRVMQTGVPMKLAITEGFGESIVVATENIKSGSFLGQYTGQIVSKQKLEEKLSTESNAKKQYVLPLSKDLVIDATDKGSICRLACHSCSPNAEVEVWKVEGLDCLALYSLRDIKANESVTFDHSAQVKLLRTNKRCRCGTRSCRKILGEFAYGGAQTKCSVCSKSLLPSESSGKVLLHPDLVTPICEECLSQYNEVDWSWKLMTSKTPGKEGACRWCTKSGKTVNCSDCPKSFCNKCLKNNLGANYIKLAETGSWTCLVCDSRPLDKIRSSLWCVGEAARNNTMVAATQSSVEASRLTEAGFNNPATRGRQNTPRGGLRGQAGAVRTPRQSTPRAPMTSRFMAPRGASPRVGTPQGANRAPFPRPGTPFPRQSAPGSRVLSSNNVTIEKVAKSPSVTPPVANQAKSGQAQSIISQLQRYSGLSIQPISESMSHVDEIMREVEVVYKSLQDACNEVKRLGRIEGVLKTKNRLGDAVKAAKTKLSSIESKFQ